MINNLKYLKNLKNWLTTKNPHGIKFLLILLLALFFLFENLLLAYNKFQSNRPILGLKLQNKNLGIINQNQLEKFISTKANAPQKALIIRTPQATVSITQKDIGAKINSQKLTSDILAKGREGSLISNMILQNKAILGFVNVPFTGNINKTLLAVKVLSTADDLNKKALPQMPDFQNDMNATIPATDGQHVDAKKLTSTIVANIFDPPNNPIDIPTTITKTNHTDSELQPIRTQAAALVKAPLSETSGGLTFTLEPADLKSLLTVVERPDTHSPNKQALQLRLDDIKLNQKLSDFATKVEAKTHAEFNYEDARVLIFSQFYSGRRYLAQVPTGQSIRVLGAEAIPGQKIAYLTFDDGPNSIYHPLILDILKAYNINATFFLIGSNVQKYPDITQRTIAEGHEIGNHSLTHPFLPNLSLPAIKTELQSTDDILLPFLKNQQLTLFRPPYGGVNSNVYQDAQDLKLKLTLWDVDPKDWSEPQTDVLIQRVVSATHEGADILMHSNHLATVKALPKIIETLQLEGYSFKTL